MFILDKAMSDCVNSEPLLTVLAANVQGNTPTNGDAQAGHHRQELLHEV